MAEYLIKEETLQSIADVLRSKKNSTDKISVKNFAAELGTLRNGLDYVNHDLTSIPDDMFRDCETLNSVDCYGLTSIGKNAFKNCVNLKTVVLYDSVESIDENAFKGCTNATIYCMFESQPEGWNVNWNPDRCEVIWLGGVVETWDVSATSNDEVLAKLYRAPGTEDYYTLVITGNGNMTNSFKTTNPAPWNAENDGNSFRTKICSVIINRGVTRIGSFAFYQCTALAKAWISDSVTSIGIAVFSYCTSLTSVTIPDSVKTISSAAFSYTSLKAVTIGDSVTTIGESAFSGCDSLTTVTIDASVQTIGNYAFYSCDSLEAVTIPASVTTIGNDAFSYCYHLADVYYTGTQEQWDKIEIGNNNSVLLNATLHIISA